MARDKHLKKYQAGKHTPAGKDDGACLTGHRSKYKKNDSCSYRWQAKEESKASRTGVYNKDPKWSDVKKKVRADREDSRKGTPDGMLATSSYWTKRRRLYPGGYAQKIALPNDGDWYVDGPTKDRSLRKASGRGFVPKGRNFEHVLWPYWNNAHHLIPKGTLKAQIEDKGLTTKCQKLIKGALLKAKYNVNHHVNMILLPMDKEVGIVLGLPRHLVLEDESTVVEVSPKFDHKEYNNTVERELRKVIDQYKEKAKPEAAKDCVSPNFTLSKKQLERLSVRCYKAVTKASPGRPISEIQNLPPFEE